MSPSPEKEEVEDRWPVVSVGRHHNQGARPYISDDPGWTREHFELTTYYPADSPNVLSPDEARLLGAYEDRMSARELEAAYEIKRRLRTWAADEGEETR